MNDLAERRLSERDQMVSRQIAARGIDSEAILSAFRAVPREMFVAEDLEEFAYEDTALPIPSGQTISQPYIVACMFDAAEVDEGDRVLEIGAGSGYAAAVLSRIVAQVYAIERHEALARIASARVEQLGYENCAIMAGDGLKGLPDEAPFDAILVAARIDTVPETLKRQLKIGGRLVIPVGDEDVQQLTAITRTGADEWASHDITPVRFVPLLKGTVAEDGARSASDHRSMANTPLPEAIARACEPLPPIDDDDFAAAFDRFADKRIVMLGEASHGTQEFYAARAAITRRFVERHGFTIVAVEADWPDAAAILRCISASDAEKARSPGVTFDAGLWAVSVSAVVRAAAA